MFKCGKKKIQNISLNFLLLLKQKTEWEWVQSTPAAARWWMTSFIQLAAFPEVAKIWRRQKLPIPAQVCRPCTFRPSCKAWCPFGKHSGVWDTEMPTGALPVLKNVLSKMDWSFTKFGLSTSDSAVKAPSKQQYSNNSVFPVPAGQFQASGSGKGNLCSTGTPEMENSSCKQRGRRLQSHAVSHRWSHALA